MSIDIATNIVTALCNNLSGALGLAVSADYSKLFYGYQGTPKELRYIPMPLTAGSCSTSPVSVGSLGSTSQDLTTDFVNDRIFVANYGGGIINVIFLIIFVF